MGSDITLRPTPRLKEWEARKSRIGKELGEIGTFVLRKAKDMINDIRVIKEKELWREGGYGSFGEFIDRMVGVSRSQIYKLLNADDETRKVLEIRENVVSLCDKSEPPHTSAQTTEKALNEAPKKTGKGRRTRPEPEPQEATFTEPIPPAPIPATVTESEAIEQARKALGPVHAAFVKSLDKDLASVCPHCGGAI